MKRTSYILSMIAAASALLLSGCAKELSVVDESPLTFGAEIAGIHQVKSGAEGAADAAQAEQKTVYLRAENGSNPISMTCKEYDLYEGDTAVTKAALQTSVNSFTVIGYNNSSVWFPQTTVTTGDSYPAYRWKSGENRTFFAYANMPSGVTPTFSENGVSLTDYVVPDTAAGELDAMLGRCVGSAGSSTGTAAIKFYHPFAAVEFQVGTLSGVTAISEISIEGVYAKGSTSLNASTAEVDGIMPFTWTTDGTKTVSQTISGDLPESGQPLCVPFVLIPQDLASANVTVKIQATTSEGAKTYLVTVNTGAWQAGKKYVYTLNYSNGPDPEFWVDLGMVSKNGHRLYVSRLPVASVVDGKAVLTNDASQCTKIDFATAKSITKDQNGLDCRLISRSEMNDIIYLGLKDDSKGGKKPDYEAFMNFVHSWKSVDGLYGYEMSRDGDSFFMPFRSNDDANNIEDYFAVDSEGNKFVVKSRDPSQFEGNVYKTDIPLMYVSANCSIDYGYSLLVHEDQNVTYSVSRVMLLNPTTTACIIGAYNSSHSYFPADEPIKSISGGFGGNAALPTLCLELDNGYISTSCYHNFSPSLGIMAGPPYYKCIVQLTSQSMDYQLSLTSELFPDISVNRDSYYGACLVKGILLTLADGSKKAVENITYDDVVKVWNFDKGCYDTAKFLFISQPGLKHDHYIKLTFSDGTVLNVTGQKSHHHVYNYTDRFFQGVTKMEPGTEVFTENGVVTLVSKEWIDEEVEYYNFITEEHVNCFANGVLTSSHYGNIYPIDENMKFIKDGRKKVPYSEFKKLGINREWYNELRLGEQPDSLDVLKKYVDKVQSYQLEKPAPSLWQRIRTWWKSIFG